MTVNISESADCKETCIHPNNHVSYVLVRKEKNFTEALSYCEDLNGTLAEFLNLRAYQAIQSCCKSITFRIGLVQDEDCVNNSTHPFRWASEINRCRRVKHLNVTKNTSLGNTSCKTVSIATTSSQTEIPQAKLDDCKETQPFICRKRHNTSDLAISTTTTIAATSEEKTVSKQSTTHGIISTAVFTDRIQTIQETRYTGQSLLTSATAFAGTNTAARVISYPGLIGGITLGFVLLIGLISFFVYRRCKKSGFQKISSKNSSKNRSITQDQSKYSQNIRMNSHSDSQPANLTNINYFPYETAILSNKRESLLQFQIQEDLSNLIENDTGAVQPQHDKNKNENENKNDAEAVQPQQDEIGNKNNTTAVQSQQRENEYDDVAVQSQQNENEYDAVAVQSYQNENEYDTVAAEPQQGGDKNVNNENWYDKLDFQSEIRTNKKRNNYENLWQTSTQSKPADTNLIRPENIMEIQSKSKSSSYSQVNKRRKNTNKETDQSDQ